MLKNPKRWAHIYAFMVFMGITGNTFAYEYPIADPYKASIIGTPFEFKADITDKVDIETKTLTVFENRQSPEIFWYNEQLKYSLATQEGAAPLIFVIAGTGANYNSAKVNMLLKVFYQAGFHVVTLSSPTHPSFIVSASLNSVPGHIQEDSMDLYHVMELIWQDIGNEIEVTDFNLTGYSLGGAQSAFVSKLDEQRKVFNFNKVLMINPPVSLFNSVAILDDMLVKNIPGGLDKMDAFMAETMDEFSEFYAIGNFVNVDSEFLYAAFKKDLVSIEKLKAVIGISFRISAGNMFFTSDVMKNRGYLVPKNLRLSSSDSLTNYMSTSFRVSFNDYFNEYFYPYFQSKNPKLSKQDLIDNTSLKSIENYLATSTKIGLITNQDDFIMAPGEIEYLQKIFNSRAKIFPDGGHCGNMDHKENVAYMLEFFKH
ncbi:MAG: alpha/beta hydrolase [Methylomarinum sp.]|nr:alpha/beta hydrolase [Methylomarinum sp.]